MSRHYDTIAILEPDPLHHELLTNTLVKLGYGRISVYCSGEQLVDAIHTRDCQPDLIVTELTTDDLDYFAFLRALDQKAFDGDILIISNQDTRVLDTAKAMAQSFGYVVLGVLEKPLKSSALRWVFRERDNKTLAEKREPSASLDCCQILKGLRRGQLTPYYQPQWDPTQQRVVGFEALARWQTESGGILPPSAFIPPAESCGVIDQLTIAFLHQVFADAGRLIKQYGDIHLAVNFSVDTLQNLALPDLMVELSRRYQVPSPANIVIEVTESRLSSKRINLLEVLARLHLMGFWLSIDDFGTGYSSLYRIKDIPFSELKIDRSFVQSASYDESSRAVIKSSVNLAEDLGMRVVAEGVETLEQQQYVINAGCKSVQGFYYSKPVDFQSALDYHSSATESQLGKVL